MNDNQFGTILEDIDGKMDTVLEVVGQMQDQIKILPAMQTDLEEVKADVKTIKAVVTSHSQQLDDHQSRITVLESA